jgi:Putative DNA-binding domain
MIDLFTASFGILTNDELFFAISELAKNQPGESARHDFKLVWTSDTLKDVAAFSNTFGGLLILGVAKNSKSSLASMDGIRSPKEITTGVASSIATNISPTPEYDIIECFDPADRESRYCVIRVRSGSILHLVTKKEIPHAVYVRNQDQTIPADGARLRMLIDREMRAAADLPSELLNRASKLLDAMNVNLAPQGAPGLAAPSPTFLKIALIPRYAKPITLDILREQEFVRMVYRRYPRFLDCVSSAVAVEEIDRSGDFYDYGCFHQKLAYQSRWRITSTLEMAHAVQMRCDKDWSVVDLAAYSVLMVMLGSEWWRSNSYFGEGILVAELRVQGLSPRLEGGAFRCCFDPGIGPHEIKGTVLSLNTWARNRASAHIQLNFASMQNDIPNLVTTLMNTLLRSLGHGIRWTEFRDAVDSIVHSVERHDSAGKH